jgi:HAE1 family hydrophobic/amphiphilic exporter-1
MTTLTTVLGLLPMALGLGSGGETQAPLARAVIGGLTSSTMITLLIIPVVYSLLESLVAFLKRKVLRQPVEVCE